MKDYGCDNSEHNTFNIAIFKFNLAILERNGSIEIELMMTVFAVNIQFFNLTFPLNYERI